MVEWVGSSVAPVYLHAVDRQWVMRRDPCIEFWRGQTKALWEGLTLIRAGGHFEGGTVLHWPAGADGRGKYLTGDILQVAQDHRWVSFIYSFPNYWTIPAHENVRIVTA